MWSRDSSLGLVKGPGVKGSVFVWCISLCVYGRLWEKRESFTQVTLHRFVKSRGCTAVAGSQVPQTGLKAPPGIYSSIGCSSLSESVPRHARGPDPPFYICSHVRIPQFHHKTILPVLSLCGVKSQYACCKVKGMGSKSSKTDHNSALLGVPSALPPDLTAALSLGSGRC